MSDRYHGQGGYTDAHVSLIAPVRDALEATGLPYVIENVCGARPEPLRGLERPRLFDSNVPLTAPPARKAVDPIGIYGHRQGPDGRRLWTRKDGSILRAARTHEEAQEAMDVPWMTQWSDITESIPPAYTKHIGLQLIDYLAMQAAA